MMKGRADDRRLFERGVKLNVVALVDSAGFDAEGLAKGVELGEYGLKTEDLTELKRLQKQIDTIHKQQAELSAFDEKFRHYADHRIGLDLDDGVKVNYGKFGDLLAEVKVIHGMKPEIHG